MGAFTLGPGSGWTSGELLSLSKYLSFYLSLYLSLYVSLFLSSPLWHHMLSLRESLRVFLAGAPSPCREVGSGTDKFNDDQQFFLQYYTNKRFAVIWKYVKSYLVTLQNSEVGPINLMTINDLRLVSMIYGQGGTSTARTTQKTCHKRSKWIYIIH